VDKLHEERLDTYYKEHSDFALMPGQEKAAAEDKEWKRRNEAAGGTLTMADSGWAQVVQKGTVEGQTVGAIYVEDVDAGKKYMLSKMRNSGQFLVTDLETGAQSDIQMHDKRLKVQVAFGTPNKDGNYDTWQAPYMTTRDALNTFANNGRSDTSNAIGYLGANPEPQKPQVFLPEPSPEPLAGMEGAIKIGPIIMDVPTTSADKVMGIGPETKQEEVPGIQIVNPRSLPAAQEAYRATDDMSDGLREKAIDDVNKAVTAGTLKAIEEQFRPTDGDDAINQQTIDLGKAVRKTYLDTEKTDGFYRVK